MHFEEDAPRVYIDSEFKFSHLSEDKTLAYFEIDGCSDKYKPIVRSRLRDYVESMDFQNPSHTIQIRRTVNDSPIPRLSIDYENFELSCDWRQLYTTFFGEEVLYHKLTSACVKRKEDWAQSLGTKSARGEIDMMAALEQAISAFADWSDDSRKTARRARIRRQYRELDGTEWDPESHGDVEEEKKILKRLAQELNLASLEEYSDDSEGGGSEQDEDDEGEWEDEGEEEGDEEGSEVVGPY